MNSLIVLLVLGFGLAAGRIMTVLIYAIPRSLPVAAVLHRCESCRRKLDLWDHLPIASYLMFRGRCRNCNAPLPFGQPVVEIVTAILFLLILTRFDFSFKTFGAFFFVSSLLIVAVIDLGHRIIPNRVIVPALAAGGVLLLVKVTSSVDLLPLVGISGGAYNALAGFALGGGTLLVVALINPGWMGGGDVKLGAFMGLFLGNNVLLAMFLASFAGAVTGALLMAFKMLKRKDTIPFGPFLAASALVILLGI